MTLAGITRHDILGARVQEAPKWHPEAHSTRDWYDDEPPLLPTVIGELQRFKRRAKVNIIRVLLVASLLSAFVVKRVATKPRLYVASVTLRVAQGDLNDERTSPLPTRALQDYIYNYVLNKAVLEKNLFRACEDNTTLEDQALEESEIKPRRAARPDAPGAVPASETPGIPPDIPPDSRTTAAAETPGAEPRACERPAFPEFYEMYDELGLDEAVVEFRDFLDVGVHGNYFLYARNHESTARSVTVRLRYSYSEPEQAYKIVAMLANVVVEEQSAKRLQEARYADKDAREQLARAELLLDEKKAELAAAQYDTIRGELVGDMKLMTSAQVRVDLISHQLKQEEIRMNGLRMEQQAIAMRLRVEENDLALHWELAGDERPERIPAPGPVRLAVIAMVCFFVFLPLSAIGFGFIDSRIHELEDITRLGIPTVGHLPSFEGDRVGSLRDRGALGRPGLLGRINFIKNRRMRDNRVA